MFCAASWWSPSPAMSVYPQRSLGKGGAGTQGEDLRYAGATLPGHSAPWRLQRGEPRAAQPSDLKAIMSKEKGPKAIHDPLPLYKLYSSLLFPATKTF